MATRTRIVLLMHPREFRRETCTTGRLTCLNLANSEIIMGLEFDDNERVRTLVEDPQNYPVVLYPSAGAMDITAGGFPAAEVGARQLVVFLLDATWINARKMLQRSPSLLRLPRLMFTPREPSRFVIKRQPRAGYLSTLETTHELLLALDAAGLDAYPDKTRLLRVFTGMQDFQIGSALQNAERAAEPLAGAAAKMPRRATRGVRRPLIQGEAEAGKEISADRNAR